MIQAVLTMVVSSTFSKHTIQVLQSLLLEAETEPGFISGGLWRDTDDPEVLCYVEEWCTLRDVDRQIRSDRYTRLLRLIETAVERPDFRLKEITQTKGMEYLETLRLPSTDVKAPASMAGPTQLG
jgi:quinol monooxygenase YgiN